MHSTGRVERIRASVREQRAPIAALVTTFCAVIFISVSPEQVTGARIGRFGPVARDLSELEIAQITISLIRRAKLHGSYSASERCSWELRR